MPYKNIVFVKLFLTLFDGDDRFLYQLTERQQLLYIKMLYLAGRQDNKIAKSTKIIKNRINYQGTTQELTNDLERIKEVFKKFKQAKRYYTFTKFEELTNYIKTGTPKELLGNAQVLYQNKSKSKIKNKSKSKKRQNFPLTPLQILWNETCLKLKKVLESSIFRQNKERRRLEERPLEKWKEIFSIINNSVFCCGKNDQKWEASYDWIMKNQTYAIRALEGKYDGVVDNWVNEP